MFDWRGVTAELFTVCAVKQHHRPELAYVAVGYRDHWFYIGDRDHASKATFNLMLQLTRLDLSGEGSRSWRGSPLLTLPVGRERDGSAGRSRSMCSRTTFICRHLVVEPTVTAINDNKLLFE